MRKLLPWQLLRNLLLQRKFVARLQLPVCIEVAVTAVAAVATVAANTVAAAMTAPFVNFFLYSLLAALLIR